ncbi:MAG: hypothetical protein AB1633_03825, partial [Elusimicrobiota bacterium]
KNKTDCLSIIKEVIGKTETHPKFNLEKLYSVYIEMWNEFAAKGDNYYEKGPIEKALVCFFLGYSQNRVNPLDYKNRKTAEKKIAELQEKWLKTPFQELGGKTPEEVILDERRKMGNPHKEIKYITTISEV